MEEHGAEEMLSSIHARRGEHEEIFHEESRKVGKQEKGVEADSSFPDCGWDAAS